MAVQADMLVVWIIETQCACSSPLITHDRNRQHLKSEVEPPLRFELRTCWLQERRSEFYIVLLLEILL